MNVLFVVPPFPGHVHPAITLASEVERRGHAVAWVTLNEFRDSLPQGANLFGFDSSLDRSQVEELLEQSARRWLAGLKVMWEEVVLPMGRDMLPAVEQAVDQFRPDVMVADEICTAGSAVAEKAGVPWATSSPTAWLYSRELQKLPKINRWILDQLQQLYRLAGLSDEAIAPVSRDLVLLYTSRAVAGEDMDYPPQYKFVGPLLSLRKERGDFPWHWLDGRRTVFASAGTVYRPQGVKLLRTVAEALAGEDLQVVIQGNAEVRDAAGPNTLVMDWVPQLELLERVDAVVTQGGITVDEALSLGIPLIVAPIAQDQFTRAEQVNKSGAGIRVRYDRVRPAQMREAVMTLLDEPSYRQAALGLAESFKATGGVAAAADALEGLSESRSRAGVPSR